MNKSAVIIGGGLGGLATALRLATSGWRVTVCEQGTSFGGKMNSWCERGFRFDTGPSLITMPWVFEDLFNAAGARMQDYIELVQMRPLADYIFADGVRFSYSASMPEWLDTIRKLEPSDVEGFFKFMELGARLYEISEETFLRRRPFDRPTNGASEPSGICLCAMAGAIIIEQSRRISRASTSDSFMIATPLTSGHRLTSRPPRLP